MKQAWLYSDPLQTLKGEYLSALGSKRWRWRWGWGGVLISASAEPHSAGPCTLRNSRGHNTFLSLVPPSGAVSISLCGMFKRLPLVTAQDSSTLSLTPNTSNCIQPASGKSVCVVYVCVCVRARACVCASMCVYWGGGMFDDKQQVSHCLRIKQQNEQNDRRSIHRTSKTE